jgi:type 1 fimbria pilin
MIRMKRVRWFASFLGALFVCAGSAHATDIGGTISTTLTITEDSQLVDDVTCTVVGLPCIAVGAPHVTLELNGFTMTGQADAQTACNGGPTTVVFTALEDGIDVNGQRDVAIRGPGLIQRFRGPGILLFNSSGATVRDVAVSTNCFSGIWAFGGSDHDIRGNVSVRNGNGSFPCGGI